MDKATLIKRNATIAETVRLIKQAAKEASRRPFTLEAANKISSLKELHDFVYNLAVYREDPPGKQLIRTPERLKRDGIGNCVDYSTAVSAILQAKGIPHKLRVTGYNGETYSHIYPVVKNSPIDVVAGQLQDGSETIENRSKPAYNYEAPYTIKKDYQVMPDVYILQGWKNAPDNYAELRNKIQVIFDTSGGKCDNVYGLVTGGSIRKAAKIVNEFVLKRFKKQVDEVNKIHATGAQFKDIAQSIFNNSFYNYPLSAAQINQLKNSFFTEANSITSAGIGCNKQKRTQKAVDFVNRYFTGLGITIPQSGAPIDLKQGNKWAIFVVKDSKYGKQQTYNSLMEFGQMAASIILPVVGGNLAIPNFANFMQPGLTQPTPGTQAPVTTAGFSEAAIFLGAGLLLTFLLTQNEK